MDQGKFRSDGLFKLGFTVKAVRKSGGIWVIKRFRSFTEPLSHNGAFLGSMMMGILCLVLCISAINGLAAVVRMVKLLCHWFEVGCL